MSSEELEQGVFQGRVLQKLEHLTDRLDDAIACSRHLDKRTTSLEHDRIRFKWWMVLHSTVAAIVIRWLIDHAPAIIKKLSI